MTEALWSDVQQLFHVWTGNRLRMHAHASALEEIESGARRQRMQPHAYLRALDRDDLQEEREALIDRLVNRTTWFLRDASGLYALVEHMKQRQRSEVSVWVAGCSTGQEPYTLTMALLDAGLRPRVLATDISREALRIAAKGRYRNLELGRVPERWKRLYFVPVGDNEMRVAAQVRDCITFQHNNLALSVPGPGTTWDAVVCRNVLLHFEREHAVSIIRSLNSSTELLLLSPVEQPLAWITHAKRLAPDDIVLLRGDRASPVPAARQVQLQAPSVRNEPPVVDKGVPTIDVRDLVGEACQLLARGDLDRAISLCDTAIASDRLFPAGHLAKGIALKRAGKFAEAVPVLRCARFLTHDEDWLGPYTLARCLERIGDREGAIEAYRHALGIVEGGGAAGLSSWDPSVDAFAQTVSETCRARLAAIVPGGTAAGPRSRRWH